MGNSKTEGVNPGLVGLNGSWPDFAVALTHLNKVDHDRYFSVIFAPGWARPALTALYAVNWEIARTREMATQPMLGLMRLQWWRDVIADIYEGKAPRHGVAEGLLHAVQQFNLTRGYFDALIDAREKDMDQDNPETLAELLSYADHTNGGLVNLAAEILMPGASRPLSADIRMAASHAGIAAALVGLMRALPFHLTSGRIYLPQDIMDQNRISLDDLSPERRGQGFKDAVGYIIREAFTHEAAWRRSLRTLPRQIRPAFVPAMLARRHRRRFGKALFDPYDPRVRQAPPWQVWSLMGDMWF